MDSDSERVENPPTFVCRNRKDEHIFRLDKKIDQSGTCGHLLALESVFRYRKRCLGGRPLPCSVVSASLDSHLWSSLSVRERDDSDKFAVDDVHKVLHLPSPGWF